MAKENGSKGEKNMFGPLYTTPGDSLGPTRPSGPMGGKATPDPLGLAHGKLRTGPTAKSDGSQKHDKD